MSGFNPGPPYQLFGPMGPRGPPFNNMAPAPCPLPIMGTPQAGPFKGFRNTYDNNPIGCLQERFQNFHHYGGTDGYHHGVQQYRKHEHEQLVNDEWEDSDEWNDYDNLSHDEEEEEEVEENHSEAKVDLDSDAKPKEEISTTFNEDRKSFDSEQNADEVAISIFKADESGTLQQVGFQQPKKLNETSTVNADFQNLDSPSVTSFPRSMCGSTFQNSSSAMNGFGTFLDTVKPPQPPHISVGFNNFGRGSGGRGRGYLRPLTPQEEMFSCGSNLDSEYDSVLPNGLILKDEYFTSVKTVTPRGNKKFTTKVTLPNGLKAVGTGGTKKVSKHNAARAMLDILEGRASAVTEEVSQSITDGLKALRGDQEKSPGTKTFKPQFVCKQSEQEYLESQKKHQEEIIKQSLEYGPLGVKLWFSGDSKIKEITSDPSTSSPTSQLQPNRAPSEPFNTDDDRFSANKGQFFISGPVHNETIQDFIGKIIVDAAWMEILKREGKADSENVCKLCNLVFKNKKYYEEHKYTDDHLHVCKGFFPGKGGYHCFLCWISFNQPEGLLNHVSRANHQKRSEKKGVSRIWMEPVSNKSWDLINVHKHLEDCRREDASRDWKTRDESRRVRSRSRSKDRKGKRRSPEKWCHDKYEEDRTYRNKLASEYNKRREVKDEKWRSSQDEKSRHRSKESRESSHQRDAGGRESRSSHREDSKGRHSRDKDSRSRQRKESLESHYEDRRSHTRDETSHRSYHDDPGYREVSSSSSDLREILREKRRDDQSSGTRLKRKSREKTDSKKKKSRRYSAGSDHEEVNEIQEDFEIDSVGNIENGEATLQKMKSAIIGILDEEIFALSKKK